MFPDNTVLMALVRILQADGDVPKESEDAAAIPPAQDVKVSCARLVVSFEF